MLEKINVQSSDHDEIETKEHNCNIDEFTSLTTYEILTAPTTYIAGSCISPILHYQSVARNAGMGGHTSDISFNTHFHWVAHSTIT